MDTWLKEIAKAQTEADVVAAARDYVSLFSPRELEPLPEDCRRIRIDAEADVSRWRKKLAEEYPRVRQKVPETGRLGDLVNYLSRASERLEELRQKH